MKLLYIALIALVSSPSIHSKTLIFNGVGDYEDKDSPLGVKVFRGTNSQKNHDRLMKEYKKENIEENNIVLNNNERYNFVKKYDLSNIKGVTSTLSINKDNTFYWSMKYDDTYLNTKGIWKLSNNMLVLNTNPKPKDIMFNYMNSPSSKQSIETKRLGTGDLMITVDQPKNGSFEEKGISGISVTCIGMYGASKSITDKKGNAQCEHAGYPIRKIILKAKGIENSTYWNNPKFTGTHWKFSFDILSAHTDYQFDNENFEIKNGTLLWNGRSIGANQYWIYK